MAIYRDRVLVCPACGIALTRVESRDLWRCSKCDGRLATIDEVMRQLVTIAPGLVPEGERATDLATVPRRSTTPPRRCPGCGSTLDPVFLAGAEIDRCHGDRLLWFDAGDTDRVEARARAQKRHSWLAALLDG
jgi:Zn-finger nucleic acid-binding protein